MKYYKEFYNNKFDKHRGNGTISQTPQMRKTQTRCTRQTE